MPEVTGRIECTLESEAFDAYFYHLVMNASEEEKVRIPPAIYNKVIRKEKYFHYTGVTTFFEKLAILFRAFRKDIYIVIRDTENGLTPEQFIEWDREEKKRNYSEDSAKKLLARSEFVLGNNDIANGLLYNRMLGASGIYKFLTKYHHATKFARHSMKNAFNEVCKLLIRHELAKRAIYHEFSIRPSEWLILLYLSDGQEKKGSLAYQEVWANAHFANRLQMSRGFVRLTSTGHIQRFGTANQHITYRITPLGLDLINKALAKHVLIP